MEMAVCLRSAILSFPALSADARTVSKRLNVTKALDARHKKKEVRMTLRSLSFLFLWFFLVDVGWAQENAEEWFKKGNEATEAGDYEEALRCFERTVALDAAHLGGYRNMGCVYGMRGMWAEAIEPFQKALAIDPNDAHIRHNLGFCWYKEGHFDEAVAEFEKAIALDLTFRDAYHNLGIVYGKKGLFDKAIPMFKEALRIGPNNPETHFSLAKAYKELGQNILAADHYYKAGILYLEEGYREGALTAYENILPFSQEIAGILLQRLYEDEEVSAPPATSTLKQEEAWHVPLRRMNVREGPSTSSQIIGKVDENDEFQIIEEASNNDASNAWYFIKTKSGLSGWLCGVYQGRVKYKNAAESSFLSFPADEKVGRP